MDRDDEAPGNPLNAAVGGAMDAIGGAAGSEREAQPEDTELAAQARGEGAEGTDETDTGVNMFTSEGDESVPPDADDLQGGSNPEE